MQMCLYIPTCTSTLLSSMFPPNMCSGAPAHAHSGVCAHTNIGTPCCSLAFTQQRHKCVPVYLCSFLCVLKETYCSRQRWEEDLNSSLSPDSIPVFEGAHAQFYLMACQTIYIFAHRSSVVISFLEVFMPRISHRCENYVHGCTCD